MFIQSEMTQRKRWTDVLTVPNIHTLLLFFFILSSAVLLILKLHDHQESIEIALTLGDIAPVQMSLFLSSFRKRRGRWCLGNVLALRQQRRCSPLKHVKALHGSSPAYSFQVGIPVVL